jgi:hypothetical protein
MMLHINCHFCGEELLYISIGTSLKLNAEFTFCSGDRRGEQEMWPGSAERISYLGICLPNSDISWGKQSLFMLGFLRSCISNRLPYKEDGMSI